MTSGAGAHRGFIYAGRDEYVAVVGRYIRDGIEAGERILVMATPERQSWIRQDLEELGEAVVYRDSTEAFGVQSHAARAMLQYLGHDGRPSRVVAEQHLTDRHPFEIRDYTRFEAASNVVYGHLPVCILCPYDAAALGDEVVQACRQTHPVLVDTRGVHDSPLYVEPRSFIVSSAAVIAPPLTARAMAIATTADVSAARHFVRRGLNETGFDPATADEITVAAVEILTNALLHGLGPRTLYMYEQAAALVVHVQDAGPGLADPLAGFFPPGSAVTHGRGLWMARQLCNTVEVATDRSGTHVRLLSRLP